MHLSFSYSAAGTSINDAVEIHCEDHNANLMNSKETEMHRPSSGRATGRVQRDERLFVRSLERGLQVLAAFSEHAGALGLADIARLTGIDKSAAQRLVHTLWVLGYIKQDSATRRYALSPKTLEFGNSYLRMDNVLSCAKPYLAEASRACEETVNLTELIETDIVYVARIPSRHMISVDILLGARLPAYCTAPGRAILAFMPQDQRSSIIQRSGLHPITRYTVTDPDQLDAILRNTREHGYAICEQESYLGDISAAAPVLNSRGYPVAAINVAVSATRWTASDVEQSLAPIIVNAAMETSDAMRAAGF